MIFDNAQSTVTGSFKLSKSIESFSFISVVSSFGGDISSNFDYFTENTFVVDFLKRQYGKFILITISDYNNNQITLEKLNLTFNDGMNFTITDNVSVGGGADTNNKIRYIYGWL